MKRGVSNGGSAFLITELKCDSNSSNKPGGTPLHAAAEGGVFPDLFGELESHFNSVIKN